VTGVEVVGEGGEEEGEGVRVAAREAGEEAERERVREHAEEVVGGEGGGGVGAAEQGERVGGGGGGGGGGVVERRQAGEGGEEVREEARSGEAEDGEAGVCLLDVAGGGRAPRQERGEELPHVGVGARVEGGGAPGGRRVFGLHGDGGADQLVASVAVFPVPRGNLEVLFLTSEVQNHRVLWLIDYEYWVLQLLFVTEVRSSS
jgi:hypothetical protein